MSHDQKDAESISCRRIARPAAAAALLYSIFPARDTAFSSPAGLVAGPGRSRPHTVVQPEMSVQRCLLQQDEQGFLLEVIEEGDLRSLYFAGQHLQSRMSLAAPERLLLPYTWYMMFFLLFAEQPPQSALIIGVGAGSIVRFLHWHFPECHIDAVDNSAAVLAVADQYFQLRESSSLRLHCQDGRQFLQRQAGYYDVIMLDAFDGEGMAADLHRPDFFPLAASHLLPGGQLCCNLWSSRKKEWQRLVRQLRQHFPGLLLLPVPQRGNVVALSPPTGARWWQQCADQETLARLATRYGLDFTMMAATARRANGNLWQRLFQA